MHFKQDRGDKMILACHQISLSFGTETVLENISFHIEEHEKAAIVGINGAGKSTLLKIITGELPADSGTITFAKGCSMGYLAQHQEIDTDRTIYDELMSVRQDITDLYTGLRQLEARMQAASPEELPSLYASYDRMNHTFEQANGYAIRSEVAGVLKGLGFSEKDFDTPVHTLSGGQKTRVALGRLLLTKPDLIMLDEPTNHLDMNSIAWLENFLSNYPGAVIIVAHDRYFLDKVVTKVIEIEHHTCRSYEGNYTLFAEKKAQIRDAQLKAWYNQQQEIRHQEAVIEKLRSFNREKSIKRAESREKMLARTERLEKPQEENAYMRLSLRPDIESGNDVLHIEGLSKRFGDHRLFENINIDIKRGEKVAVIGNNGTGKTTILKIINRIVPPDAGTIRLGSNVHIGYYDQEQQVLDPDKTIFQEISDTWPSMTGTRIRNVLAAFLFTGDDVFKYIRDLSGGERGRVSLAKLMLSDANLLILDEPTNHLDIMSKEILENAVSAYTGTVLFVSHDRYFINRTATRILELSESGLAAYDGNYDAYLEKKDNPMFSASSGSSVADATEDSPAAESDSKLDYKRQKQLQAQKRKRENDLKRTLSELETIDQKLAKLDETLALPEVYTNSAKLLEISEEKEKLELRQLELMELWEALENEGD